MGIHSDTVVNRVRGFNLPLMNVHERVFSVLGCRFVDDVLIDDPYVVSPEMIASLKIAEVVHGTNSDQIGNGNRGEDRYKYAKEANIYRDLLTLKTIVTRDLTFHFVSCTFIILTKKL